MQNEKEFREGVERLYQLTSDLRDELQKTVTTDVLSVHMVKKTEEIEKLAKVLKNKAKGA
jgi:heme oxygenase